MTKKSKMTSHFGNPYLTALQHENDRNSLMYQFQSAGLDDESSFDDHKIPLVGKRRAPGLSPSSTLDFDEVDSRDIPDMNLSSNLSSGSSSTSSSANVGLEKCALEKRQSNSSVGSVGLPSSYPSFHCTADSVATYATYPEDLDDFEEFQIQFERSRISVKPPLHPLLFVELPPPPPKIVTPEIPKRRRSGRNQLVITSTEDFQCMVSKSNQNRRRRNMAMPSATEIEKAVREEMAMGPISIEGKLAL